MKLEEYIYRYRYRYRYTWFEAKRNCM